MAAGPLSIGIDTPVWRYAEPFVIARGVLTVCEALSVTLTDDHAPFQVET